MPDGSPGDPPESPPPQTGDPAAQTTQQVFAYEVDADGTIAFGMMDIPLQGQSSGTTPFNSIYDTNTGTVIAADASFTGQSLVLAPPANIQSGTVYFYDSVTDSWDAVPLTIAQTNLLSPAAGTSVTPLPSADGLGVAWAVHPQQTAVPNGTPALATATPGAAPPAPVQGVPPGYPSGAWAIDLPPGSTIQLPDGRTVTFPGGVKIIVNPIDGGTWLMPIGQPGVVIDPSRPPGQGDRQDIPLGTTLDLGPGTVVGGTYTPGGPGSGQSPQPLPTPPRPDRQPTPLWDRFFGGSGTPGRMPPIPRYIRPGPGPGSTPAIPEPPVRFGRLPGLLHPEPPSSQPPM